MTEALSLLFNVSVLIFVLASMFGLGLSLTLKQVFAPMRNVSLVLKSLAATGRALSSHRFAIPTLQG